jgi:hypothetical protein
MIKKPTVPLVIMLFTFAIACAATAGVPQKPRIHEIEAGHEIEPASFDDLWNGAVAVVQARVVGTKVELSKSTSTPRPITKLQLRVSEEFKGNLSLDAAKGLTVYQLAGEFADDDVTVRQLGVEPLATGREYVLFLGWNPYFGRWMVRGSNSVFELNEDQVRPHGQAPVVRERKSQSVRAFVEELRGRARNGGGRR